MPKLTPSDLPDEWLFAFWVELGKFAIRQAFRLLDHWLQRRNHPK